MSKTKMSKEEEEIMSKIDKKFHQEPISHIQGLIWCLIFGLSRGGMYAGSKFAQVLTHVQLHHVLLIRSIFLMIGAYIYGKYDGVDFGYASFMNFPDKVKWSLFKRSMYGFGSIIATFMAI